MKPGPVSILTVTALITVTAAVYGNDRTPVPRDLLNYPTSMGRQIIKSPTDQAWLEWDTVKKRVWINRQSRPNTTAPWSSIEKQIETTSYEVTSVSTSCDGNSNLDYAYVAGVYPSGTSTIEQWEFDYTSGLGGSLPVVTRTVLVQSASLGLITSVASDPDNRFILFVTRDPKKVYKLTLSGGLGGPGGTPVVLYDETSLPSLSTVMTLERWQHVSEGPIFVLFDNVPWAQTVEQDHQFVLLKDGNNDGTVDSVVVLDLQQWTNQNYIDSVSWTSPCIDSW